MLALKDRDPALLIPPDHLRTPVRSSFERSYASCDSSLPSPRVLLDGVGRRKRPVGPEVG